MVWVVDRYLYLVFPVFINFIDEPIIDDRVPIADSWRLKSSFLKTMPTIKGLFGGGRGSRAGDQP